MRAGRRVVFVDPRKTTKRCSAYGGIVRKGLSKRVHNCKCGCTLLRDHDSALTIRSDGLKTVGWGTP